MDYIRAMKMQPNYNPNTRHCLVGLDADLVMLSLATHEPHIFLLRNQVDFSRPSVRSALPAFCSCPWVSSSFRPADGVEEHKECHREH